MLGSLCKLGSKHARGAVSACARLSLAARWGGNVVFKIRGAKPRRSVNPMLLLDYRCDLPTGRIGTDYDPTLKACLTKLVGMTGEQVRWSARRSDARQRRVFCCGSPARAGRRGCVI
jgi:hypothetical protein